MFPSVETLPVPTMAIHRLPPAQVGPEKTRLVSSGLLAPASVPRDRRPTASATRQNRSRLASAWTRVEVSHKPSGVASPSNRREGQRNDARSSVGMAAKLLPVASAPPFPTTPGPRPVSASAEARGIAPRSACNEVTYPSGLKDQPVTSIEAAKIQRPGRFRLDFTMRRVEKLSFALTRNESGNCLSSLRFLCRIVGRCQVLSTIELWWES